MKNDIKKIATNFSLGKFETVFDFLSENITWNIVDENIFSGKSEVIKDENKVVIIGTAEFSRDGKRNNFVETSEFYELDNDGKIKNIKSFCISKS